MKSRVFSFLKPFECRYSQKLGIDVDSGDSREVFKWFLASVLYSAPIREESATKTYFVFKKAGVLSPQRIQETGWDGLVQLLDEGSYTRYDFKTADKLLEMSKNLLELYGGDLNELRRCCKSQGELEARLMQLAKGIGPVTVSIFLRELRGAWRVSPPLSPLELSAAEKLGIRSPASWLSRFPASRAIRLQTALACFGRDLRRRALRR